VAYEDGVFPTFFMDTMRNPSESKKQQREVYDDMLMIKIQVPNQTTIVPRPATEADKRRFPISWQAYETGVEPPEEGFPLEQWPEITAGEVATCKAVHVKTVEQLAELADGSMHKMGPGALNLKNRAKKFLERLGERDALRKENEELNKRIATQDERIDELVRAVEALTADQSHAPEERQRFSVEA
jgi:hypothetical protein